MQKLLAQLKIFLLLMGGLFIIVTIILYFDRLEPSDPEEDAIEASGIPDALQRKTIVSELVRFKKAIQSDNTEEMASFFAFPVFTDSLQAAPHIDSALLNDPKTISKSQFLKYYDRIFDPYKDGALLKRLFGEIDLQGLLIHNLLKTEVRAANEHCNYFFGIGVHHGEYINIDYGIGERPGFLAAFRRTYGIQSDECRGNAYIWTFRLIGNRLYFVKEEDVYDNP